MLKDKLAVLADALKNIVSGERRHYTSAVILAAGTGERFGTDVKKQLFLLDGIPVALRTLIAFENCSKIDEIVLVTREDETEIMREYCEHYKISKLRSVVVGGSTRQESSLIGFEAISPDSEYVLFHDGARCLVTDELITAVLRDAYKYRAAIAAEKTVDTVKYATDDGFVDSTVDRNYVWLAKTPQVFMTNMYRAAVYTANRDGITATDESMLAERLGFKVKLTDCGRENIKITTKDDIAIAVAVLEKRRKERS